jgi:23S rRNA (adenine2503-C2)-methyltransferase
MAAIQSNEAPTDPLPDPRSLAPESFLRALESRGIDAAAGRRLLGAVIGAGDFDPASWSTKGILPKRLLSRMPTLPRLREERVVVSPVDGFEKTLFRAEDGLALETVTIPLLGKNEVSVCLSSQIGCVMGCAFCATARMPVRRNLETWEIVDQLIQVRRRAASTGRAVRRVVFMGMGEPVLNYVRVIAAAKILSFPVLNAVDARAITVSTVGILDKIERFTLEDHRYRLSVSLGAATDEKRLKLVPIAARTPLQKLMEQIRRHALRRRTRVNLAYVCISGENVSPEDARALADLIGETPVRLDLIDVTDFTGAFRPPSSEELGEFRDALRLHLKQPVARRYSGGADIRAACGTLAGLG